MTQPAFPARPQAAPLPPAPLPPAQRPRALPGPAQPSPAQPGPPQAGPPQAGPPQPGPPQAGPSWGAPPQPRPAPTYPPPPYPPPVYQPSAGPQGFEPFRPYQPQEPTPAGPPDGPPRQPPRRHDGRRSGSPLTLWVILLALLVGGGAAGVLIAHPFGHPALHDAASTGSRSAAPASGGAGSASPAAPSSPASPATSVSAPAVTERQAATDVAAMLSQSVSDRAAIGNAAAQVGSCGPGLASAPKVFGDAASSRRSLLARLTALRGRSALPPALLSDLTQAWQASVAADQAYARWAGDEVTRGCVANDTGDPGYQAAVAPNVSATKYKTAFVAQWNPVAGRYGLTRYQQGQL